jgi:hypothetical protein
MTRILPLLLILMFAELTCAFETSMVVAGMSAWVRISGEPVTAGWMVTSYLLIASSSSVLCAGLAIFTDGAGSVGYRACGLCGWIRDQCIWTNHGNQVGHRQVREVVLRPFGLFRSTIAAMIPA